MEARGILGILAMCIGTVVAGIGIALAPATWPYPGTVLAIGGGTLLVLAGVWALRGSPRKEPGPPR